MTFDASKDIVFIEALVTFHERREEAIELPVPSDLLLSLRQHAGLVIGGEMLADLQRMGDATEIKKKLAANSARAEKITLWTEKMIERQDGWAVATRKKNIRKLKRWHAEVEQLAEESKKLLSELDRIEGVYA